MSNETTSKKRPKTQRCKICDDEASYTYFGAIVCEACKMFFKRYAENHEKLAKCKFNGECEMTKATRHNCSSCRMKKCFQSGMEVEKLRHSSIVRKKKKNDDQPAALLPTRNLLRKDTSLLTCDQWNLLTNLVHNYQVDQLFSQTAKLKGNDELKNNSVVSLLKVDETLAQQFLLGLYETAARAFRINENIKEIDADDRSILLPTAVDNCTCFAATFIFSRSELYQCHPFINYIEQLYGQMSVNCHRWTSRFALDDPVLFQLGLSLFFLSRSSSTCYPNLNEHFQHAEEILQLENKYVDLTWKYLLYKYNSIEANRKFLQLIQWFMAVTVLVHCGHQTEQHVNYIQNLIDDTEHKLCLADIDRLVEIENES